MHFTHKIIVVYNNNDQKEYRFTAWEPANKFKEHITELVEYLDIYEVSPILEIDQYWTPSPQVVGSTIIDFVNDGQHQSAIVTTDLNGKKLCITISNDYKFIVTEEE